MCIFSMLDIAQIIIGQFLFSKLSTTKSHPQHLRLLLSKKAIVTLVNNSHLRIKELDIVATRCGNTISQTNSVRWQQFIWGGVWQEKNAVTKYNGVYKRKERM